MQGYMTILSEAWEIGQFDNPNNCPTHVFLQVGVGSFSGGLSGYLVNQMKVKNSKIKIITVEPREADCVYRSHQKGNGDLHGKLLDDGPSHNTMYSTSLKCKWNVYCLINFIAYFDSPYNKESNGKRFALIRKATLILQPALYCELWRHKTDSLIKKTWEKMLFANFMEIFHFQ